MELHVDQINEVKCITVFTIQAPQPPPGKAYAIYLQQARLDLHYIGQITEKTFSISQTVSKYIKDRNISSAGRILIEIEDE